MSTAPRPDMRDVIGSLQGAGRDRTETSLARAVASALGDLGFAPAEVGIEDGVAGAAGGDVGEGVVLQIALAAIGAGPGTAD